MTETATADTSGKHADHEHGHPDDPDHAGHEHPHAHPAR